MADGNIIDRARGAVVGAVVADQLHKLAALALVAWWLNGGARGRQVAESVAAGLAVHQVIAWLTPKAGT